MSVDFRVHTIEAISISNDNSKVNEAEARLTVVEHEKGKKLLSEEF